MLSLRTVLLTPLLACAALLPASLTANAPSHPWVVVPLHRSEPENYIVNLRDGDQIETPYVLRFGLTRYGLAAIDRPVSGAGHHHLLIDQDLPLDFTKPLPFNERYIHFGKGQMETVLNLKPGPHTLRMLLADHRHIPYFIYSKPIRVTVTRQRTDIDPKTLLKKGLSFLTPQDGDTVSIPFRVQFHASGFNVGHMNIKEHGAGHFVLTVSAGGRQERLAFTNGWTETWLRPPPGRYTLQLSLFSNANPLQELASSPPLSVTVK